MRVVAFVPARITHVLAVGVVVTAVRRAADVYHHSVQVVDLVLDNLSQRWHRRSLLLRSCCLRVNVPISKRLHVEGRWVANTLCNLAPKDVKALDGDD